TFALNVQSAGPPQVLDMQVNGGLAERSRLINLTAQFSDNVGASFSLSDVVLRNLTTATNLAPSSLTLNFDAATGKLTLPPAGGVVLPAGNYRLTLLAAGITNAAGQRLVADTSLEFHLLPGDANGDRVVNDLDLLEVWQNSVARPDRQNLNDDLNGDG